MSRSTNPASVVWLYGLPGSGKTTLAEGLRAFLDRQHRQICVLDGDVLRRTLCVDLGYSEAERTENVRRAAETARILCDCGITVIAALVTPMECQRKLAQDIVGNTRFMAVLVDCPVEECRKRDPKGLYRRSDAGDVADLTGVDAAFERSAQNNLVLQTDRHDFQQCLDKLVESLFTFEISLPTQKQVRQTPLLPECAKALPKSERRRRLPTPPNLGARST